MLQKPPEVPDIGKDLGGSEAEPPGKDEEALRKNGQKKGNFDKELLLGKGLWVQGVEWGEWGGGAQEEKENRENRRSQKKHSEEKIFVINKVCFKGIFQRKNFLIDSVKVWKI